MLACLYTSFITDDRRRPTTIVLREGGHLTDKSDDRVGHLNTILAREDGNLNDSISKSSNACGLRGGGVEVSS